LLDKSLHMQLKTLHTTLFNGSIHTNHIIERFVERRVEECAFTTHLLTRLQHQQYIHCKFTIISHWMYHVNKISTF